MPHSVTEDEPIQPEASIWRARLIVRFAEFMQIFVLFCRPPVLPLVCGKRSPLAMGLVVEEVGVVVLVLRFISLSSSGLFVNINSCCAHTSSMLANSNLEFSCIYWAIEFPRDFFD